MNKTHRCFYHQYKWSFIAGIYLPFYFEEIIQKEIYKPVMGALNLEITVAFPLFTFLGFLFVQVISEFLLTKTRSYFPNTDMLAILPPEEIQKMIKKSYRWKGILDLWTGFKMTVALTITLIFVADLSSVYAHIHLPHWDVLITSIVPIPVQILLLLVTAIIMLLFRFVFAKLLSIYDG